MQLHSFNSVEEWQKSTDTSTLLLHIGCGSNYLEGWCNIDGYPQEETDTHRGSMSRKPDVWADIKSLALNPESVDVIMSHHVIEHFYRHETVQIFKRFYDSLKPGGLIITEMPNLTAILNLIKFLPYRSSHKKIPSANRDIVMSQLYGAAWEENSSLYPYHKYVWEKKEFREMLKSLGYNIVFETSATLTHQPLRDMAITVQKPFGSDLHGSTSINASEFLVDMYGSRPKRFVRCAKALCRLLLAPF